MWGQENDSIINRDREVRRKGWNGKKGDHLEERQKREMGGRGRERARVEKVRVGRKQGKVGRSSTSIEGKMKGMKLEVAPEFVH